ncbi:MAG: Hpt domain-containing protein [Planctomycetes bacterium]|nr:Hpt domain-containing protein [Planctomycetota bacterium]
MSDTDFSGILQEGPLPDPGAVALPEDFSDFLDDYIESTESQLDELEQAILRFETAQTREQDAAEIRRILHKIKGESGMVGLDDMATFVHEVESAFDQLSDDRAADMLFRFKDWTTAAMAAMIANNANKGEA